MVKKKKYIVVGIVLVLTVGSIGLFHFFTTGYPVQGKQEQEIQAIVEKALRIRYGWARKEKLNKISTEAFRRQIERYDDFYEGLTFYIIEKDFMKTYHEEGQDTCRVSVRVYDPDIIIPIFTLKKGESGKFLITDFGCDI